MGRQIAHPEIRRAPAEVLAHLEDALFDLQRSLLLEHPADEAHLLGQTVAQAFRLQILPDGGIQRLAKALSRAPAAPFSGS